MKALTLRHPWPWAVCAVGKRIENRRWLPTATQLAVGDWFAIHGGKVPPPGIGRIGTYQEAMSIALRHDFNGLKGMDPRPCFDRVTAYNGVVAVCRYGGYVSDSGDPWFEGRPYGWRLDDLFVLPEPVACKGAQGLWELPNDVEERVRSQYPGEGSA